MSKRYICLVILGVLALSGSFIFGSSIRAEESPPGISEGSTSMTGFEFSLREGEAMTEAPARAQAATASPLSESETQAVLDRLPAIKVEGAEVQDYRLPTESLPPPRPGVTVEHSFPPVAEEQAPQPPQAGPLEVVRRAPEGDVNLARNLSLTFSRPMAALDRQQDLTADEVPVQLSPEPPGRWRWVGTKTLFFEPDRRFPMATRYTALVPAGTKAADGSVLDKKVQWQFSTPAPQLINYYPNGGPFPLRPVVVVVFDQAVDPKALLAKIKVKAGSKSVSIRLAEEDELKADEQARRMSENAQPGRWAAFVFEQNLPPATDVQVIIPKGTPSAEGPLTTAESQNFRFNTYGPLTVRRHHCGWDDECPPMAPWYIEFTNYLDEKVFDPAWVKVEPELPGMKVQVYGQGMTISGFSKGRTTYRVTLDAAIADVFGQTLGHDQTLTFKTTSARPVISIPGRGFSVLDPTGPTVLSVFTINYEKLKVSLYQVGASDYQAFTKSLNRPKEPIPGRLVHEKTLTIKARPDELVETAVDLSPGLKDGFGQLVVVIDPDPGIWKSLLKYWSDDDRQVVKTWVQVTHLGLDAFSDGQDLLVWVNSLADGRPVAGAKVSLHPVGPSAETGPDGLARLPLSDKQKKDPDLLVAEYGSDKALLRENAYYWTGHGWSRRPITDFLRWYVFDDRQMYRPGEEVRVKGWVRRVGGGSDGDVGPLDISPVRMEYKVIGPQGNEILKGETKVNAMGGFDLAFKLPEGMNLGTAQLALMARGISSSITQQDFYHTFQVQEFRRPEFEVNTAASEGPYLIGEGADVTVTAKYYAGGALPGAEVDWRINSSAGIYQPPGWDEFTFGRWKPWWFAYYDHGEDSGQEVRNFSGYTDGLGAHHIHLDFESVSPPEPQVVTAEATVMDVNRQAWSSSSSLLVHPSRVYVGLKSDRYFVEAGQPFPIMAIAADIEGQAVPGRKITLKAARIEYTYKNGQRNEEEKDVVEQTLTSAAEPVEAVFNFKLGGTYQITARVQDDQGRANETVITRWVSGGPLIPSREIEKEEAQLIPDRAEYQPGDTAEVLVQSPFFPAEGVVTLRRSGIVKTESIHLDGPTYTLKVPILDEYTPNVHLQVDLVGASPRLDANGQVSKDLPPRPAYASGILNLKIPPLARVLTLEVIPEKKKLEPAGETWIDLTLKDAAGHPVPQAEVALVVVDEAVLALTGYRLADPMGVFYLDREPGVTDYHSRQDVILVNPEDLAKQAETQEGEADGVRKMAAMDMSTTLREEAAPQMPMAAAPPSEGSGGGPEPIKVRMDFSALALFAPDLPTDSEGKARVKVKLPDNLTRYRIMAVATDGGKRFGLGESNITARLPLMVRPSAPRFLNFGDAFELPVALQNQTDEPMIVDLAARAVNLKLTAGQGRRVTVPANDRVEVRLPAATEEPGTARVQIGAASGRWADAAEVSLPVYTPATTEAAAVYGEVDQGITAQPIKAPEGVIKGFGGLEVSTSSTALQALTDAVLYLTAYPFECSEQIASRILAVAALKDVLAAFNAQGMPDPEALVETVNRDIERLKGFQNGDGGFPVWQRGKPSVPYYSVHVTHALLLAREQGFEVPGGMIDQALNHLANIQSYIPHWYSERSKLVIRSYAQAVLSLAGRDDPAEAARILKKLGTGQPAPWTPWAGCCPCFTRARNTRRRPLKFSGS